MTAPAMPAISAVVLRAARREDCEAIWRWNFAPDVRAWSRNTEPVALVDHTRWFARRLAEHDAPIWVIEEVSGDQRHGVGVVRLEPPRHGRARISIALAAFARGRGIGRAAIAEVCRQWGRPIVAEIFSDHAASRACFEACGFRAIATERGLVTYQWDPEA